MDTYRRKTKIAVIHVEHAGCANPFRSSGAAAEEEARLDERFYDGCNVDPLCPMRSQGVIATTSATETQSKPRGKFLYQK